MKLIDRLVIEQLKEIGTESRCLRHKAAIADEIGAMMPNPRPRKPRRNRARERFEAWRAFICRMEAVGW